MIPPTGSRSDEEPGPASSLMSVLAGRRPQSPAEERFHRLAARIEVVRAALMQWQAYGVRFN